MLAGLPGAIGSVPDGMAASVLVGVSPIYGLYASALGPVGGGLFASTRLMVITTTSAAALAAGSALSGINASDRPEALFLLTVIAGAVMVAAGLLHLGRYTRFVSHSVMIGFLSGIGVNIIFGQIPDLLGVPASGSFAAEKAVNALAHPSQVDVASFLVGLSALGIIAVISHTRFRSVAAVVALVVPSLVVIVAGLDSVARVSSAGAIPKGIPLPHLPQLSELSVSVVTGALAVAVIVLVQGAGVAESALNPDGSLSDANRDFVAQGVGNLASGFFRGQPVGGSVGQTALNVAAGAKTRWASIWSGLWMIAILAAFSGVVAKVALPTLSAVLIYAAFGSLRFGEMATIFRTGRISQVAIITTFAATLFLPVATAVGIGVALSTLLQLNREALDLAVVEVVTRPDGRFEESPAPAHVRSGSVIVLDVHGSLFYAGARTLQARLPDPAAAAHPVVLLRLRGRTNLGATSFHVLADYAQRLGAAGGRLYLSGLDHELAATLDRTGRLNASGPLKAFEATPVLGESSATALADANAWLASQADNEKPEC